MRPCLIRCPSKIKDLNILSYSSFVKATAKNSCVKLPSLVPTADVAFRHFKRVYLHGSEEKYYQKNGIGNMKAKY